MKSPPAFSYPVDLDPNNLYFLPLGGSEEIGMNLNLYHHQGKWLMVDMGITFANTPGLDVIMPDIRFIEERKKDLAGLVLTHAHEDHIGALPYLWQRLKCPLYATPFTAAMLRRKFHRSGMTVPLHEIPLSGNLQLDPFELNLINLTHSIPEPNALAIKTKVGTVIHTGDWKIDPDPLIGETTDENKLIQYGNEGVLALVCDSTNVFVEGSSGSEKQVRESLIDLVGLYPKSRIVIACFASNVARVASCIEAAKIHQREVFLMGRSLEQVDQAAREAGYFEDYPEFLKPGAIAGFKKGQTLIIATGSQGESRAALAKIARGEDKHVRLEEGDVVIFSAREIPGNEDAINKIQNELRKKGVKIITPDDHKGAHVSGHPCRDELKQMYEWVRPKILIPVHGEPKHLIEHGKWGLENNISEVIIPKNGTVIHLQEGDAKIVDHVPCDRHALDGERIIPLSSEIMHDRHRLMSTGHAIMTLVIKPSKRLDLKAHVLLVGIADKDDTQILIEKCGKAAEQACHALLPVFWRDDEKIEEAACIAVRRELFAYYGKKAFTHVQVIHTDER